MKIPEHLALEFRRALLHAHISAVRRCHQSFCVGLAVGIGITLLVRVLFS